MYQLLSIQCVENFFVVGMVGKNMVAGKSDNDTKTLTDGNNYVSSADTSDGQLKPSKR